MAEILDRTSPNGVLMSRNDSADSAVSADSPFASVLNTPADEDVLNFDAIDGKLLSSGPSQILEGLETHERGADHWRSRLGRVSLSRQFSKALEEATKSTATNGPILRARSNSVERVYHVPVQLPESLPSPDLMSFASPELPSEPMEVERVQTPELPISETYNNGSPQTIIRTTPRGRPPLRRDIFSPASMPIPFKFEGEPTASATELTPRPHSTLRHRKGMYSDLNDSITGEPASDALSDTDTDGVSQDNALDADDEALDTGDTAALPLDDDYESDSYLDAPTLPKLSHLLPLQLVLFPLWCILVGGAILLCPLHLHALAFPASAPTPRNTPLRLLHRALACVLPIHAPPSPIRAFAHWATVAHLHVAIFLAALAGAAYVDPPVGVLLAGACAALFVRAWHDFAPDADGEGGIGLGGGEVRQMLYQVLAPGCGFRDGDALRRVGDRYFLVRAPPRAETRAKILGAGGLSEEYESDEDDEESE